MGGTARRPSAGILLFRRRAGAIEVLLGHPGGPSFASKDDGAWGVPKGEVDGDEPLFDVALREFREETGSEVPADPTTAIPLGEIRKRTGKVVTVWAIEGDLDAERAASNTFRMQWPPRSGVFIDVPEFDKLTCLSINIRFSSAARSVHERIATSSE